MKTEEQLLAEIGPLQDELTALQRARGLTKANELIGKHYKYRNSYSSPKVENDYWWLYVKIIGVEESWPMSFRFMTTSQGKIEIEFKEAHYHLDSYEEITAEEFDAAWNKVQEHIAGLKP